MSDSEIGDMAVGTTSGDSTSKCMAGGRGNHFCFEPKEHEGDHRCVCGASWMRLRRRRSNKRISDLRLREALAALEHERWARWQSYVHRLCFHNDDGSLTIPAQRAEWWERQIKTPYEWLSEQEKEHDRAEADHTLALLKAWC